MQGGNGHKVGESGVGREQQSVGKGGKIIK